MADKTAYDIDLWGTSSEMFATLNTFTRKLINTKKFELLSFDKLTIITETDSSTKQVLNIGDLLYRNGHVEFYIGNNKVIGWGRIHNSYYAIKTFQIKQNGIYSSDIRDNNIPFTSILHFIGD